MSFRIEALYLHCADTYPHHSRNSNFCTNYVKSTQIVFTDSSVRGQKFTVSQCGKIWNYLPRNFFRQIDLKCSSIILLYIKTEVSVRMSAISAKFPIGPPLVPQWSQAPIGSELLARRSRANQRVYLVMVWAYPSSFVENFQIKVLCLVQFLFQWFLPFLFLSTKRLALVQH